MSDRDTMWIVQVDLQESAKWQSDLLDRMDALDRLGARDIDADEVPAAPRAYGYFDAAPAPEALAAAFGALEVRVHTLPRLSHVEVPSFAERPVHIGRFVVGGASVTGDTPADRVGLHIETHTAWGTGMHPTTALMLHRVEALAPKGRVLDVGTGTGILAIAALRLGATRAVGTDIAPAALSAAEANARANGVQAQLTVSGEPPDKVDGRFDLVLANVRADPLTQMAPGLCARLDPAGTLVLSGVRAHESGRVCAAFEACGVSMMDQTHAGGWLSISFRTRAT